MHYPVQPTSTSLKKLMKSITVQLLFSLDTLVSCFLVWQQTEITYSLVYGLVIVIFSGFPQHNASCWFLLLSTCPAG